MYMADMFLVTGRKRRSHTPPESDSENVPVYHDDDDEDELFEEPVKKKKTGKGYGYTCLVNSNY